MKWLVLLLLISSIIKSFHGFYKNTPFSKSSNSLRHWTATIAHIQLMLGITLYAQSPITKYFWNNFGQASKHLDSLFFGIIHMLLMLVAIAIITIGSAKSKRKESAKDKFKTMAIWFTIGLILIIVAIPWPFSPLAARPYIRLF
ncbi:hypothetical protein ACOKFD_14735 [Flagellimonas sp. S174]|uniref:hypothetical protein n=1 Tax=Flagellimonas sp. S174 TaxID=3410790 RepID=UPI003BF5E66C